MTGVDAAIDASADGAVVRVKVVPGASRSKVAGMLGDRLKVAVAAPPEGGKANKAVCELLAKVLGVSKSAVGIASGHGQPRKTVLAAGLTVDQVRVRLDAAVGKQL